MNPPGTPPPLVFDGSYRAERRRRRRRPRRGARSARLAVGLAVLITAASAAALAYALRNQNPPPQADVLLEVGARPTANALSPGFVGLSIEYTSALRYAGRNPAAIDPVFLALVRGLNPGQSPVLRFGGDTTDWTAAPIPGQIRPTGVRYELGARWYAVVRATAQALGARLILGVNFEADSPVLAGTEARALLNGVGRSNIAGFELGNEPEVYGQLGWYQGRSGPVYGRPGSYDFNQYLSDYAHVRAALPAGVPTVGPASGNADWLAGLRRFLDENPGARLASFHRYPLHRCYTARNSPAFPTVRNLLAPYAYTSLAESLAGAIRTAHRHGVPLRVDELNSVSCGGNLGVSDTFASALWALNMLFALDRAGVQGVNIHTFHNAWYAPFALGHAGGAWRAQVKPLYYGMLLFTRAAPPGSRLVSAVTRRPRPALQTWATRDPGGAYRVALINDAPSGRPVAVAVHLPGGASTGSVQLLTAPSLRARGAVTLNGQSFGARTSTGTLTGPAGNVTVAAADGRFTVQVPPASAALLTVPNPR